MAHREKTKPGQPMVYSMANDQCVWGKAGVIKPTKCINAFDCLGCSLDRQVLLNFEEKRKTAEKNRQRAPRMMLLANRGKCRHMLSGRIAYGLCSYGYDCARCPIDQTIEDSGWLPSPKPPVLDAASGFSVARDHYYHYGHGWARVEYGGRVRVGVDDFAHRLLGTWDEVKIPRLGSATEQNQPQVVLKRDDREAPVLSPVEGRVAAINHKLLNNPSEGGKDPYGDGWLMVIEPSSLRKNLKNLFFGDESLSWIDDEASRLAAMIHETRHEQTVYRLAATGGEAVRDIYRTVPEIGWERLVDEFLHSL